MEWIIFAIWMIIGIAINICIAIEKHLKVNGKSVQKRLECYLCGLALPD